MARFKHAARRAQPVLGATVGLIGSVLMVIALLARALSTTAEAPQRGRSSSVTVVRYLPSGRLWADLTTARNMVKYLLEPEVAPNPPRARSAPVSSSSPTNQCNHRPTQGDVYGTVL